jgi:hypothetical protein
MGRPRRPSLPTVALVNSPSPSPVVDRSREVGVPHHPVKLGAATQRAELAVDQ